MRGNPTCAGRKRPLSGSIPAYAGEPGTDRSVRNQHWVYPRVCGGTPYRSLDSRRTLGLSPRMRGNRVRPAWLSGARRSIPAYAGEPIAPGAGQIIPMVYPRVCGGTVRIALPTDPPRGLSPRMRGNRYIADLSCCSLRSIPAYAGEPRRKNRTIYLKKVYPRVCGGTRAVRQHPPPVIGLSPRMRGNPASALRGANDQGSIPAYAGEPPEARGLPIYAKVYPRVCGGTARGADTYIDYKRSIPAYAGEPSRASADNAPVGGLSPRMRGNPDRYGHHPKKARSIPAYAGEPCRSWRHKSAIQVYPRVCGGTGPPFHCARSATGLSPRMRGNPTEYTAGEPLPWSIPAYAGEPLACKGQAGECKVYPRVCGGTCQLRVLAGGAGGLSPRMRGNRCRPHPGGRLLRSIPAYAGEPRIPVR